MSFEGIGRVTQANSVR